MKKTVRAWMITAFFTAEPGVTFSSEVQVAPSDTNAISILSNALQTASSPSATEPVHVVLKGGVYRLTVPLVMSNQPVVPVIIEAAAGETAVFSGGVQITGWQKLNAPVAGLPEGVRTNVLVTDVPRINGRPVEFRQLWIGNRKAVLARTPNGEDMLPLLEWNRASQTAVISAAGVPGTFRFGFPEMFIAQQWEIADCRIASIKVSGTNAVVAFRQPESSIEFTHPWPQPVLNTNYHSPFFLANAVEFLDSAGEWFEDVAAGKIYYFPRDDEDMTRETVVAPGLETLLKIAGTPNKPVANIQFKGITFAHTTWLRPSRQGHVPLQAGMPLLNARKLSPKGMPYHPHLDNVAWIDRPPAAISIKNASHISFERCTFEHTASAGLDFESSTHDDTVEGCVFHDIGGNGMQLGTFSDTKTETHVPYNPSDESVVCTHENISNNIFSACGTEDWGCVGICAGYVRDTVIAHNEIFDLPYTGISLGWGWTKATNCMRNNQVLANHLHHIAKRLCDTGGIYTLSAQPGTIIAGNSIHDIQMSRYAFDPDHWFYIYLDEGSSFITVKDNWSASEKFLKNANGPGNIWTNNGPQVSESIKQTAGLEPAFRDLLNREPK